MADRVKIRYEIALDRIESPGQVAGATVRSITSAARASLAELMRDAYVGTIDYQGETLAQARDDTASEALFAGLGARALDDADADADAER